MTAPERLTTARMTGEAITAGHAPELAAIQLDPRVWPWLASPGEPPPTTASVADFAARQAAHWRERGVGYWLLRDRDTGEPIGRGGLRHTAATGIEEVEIGWAIAPARWGRGYATELALAAAAIGLGELGLDGVIAYTTPANHASRRVMEKAEFRYEREFRDQGLELVLYRRRR